MGSNNDLLESLVNDFFSQANLQKEAADETNPDGGAATREKELKKKDPDHTVKTVDGDATESAETDRGAEMNSDLKDSEMGAVKGDAQLAADSGAQVSEADEVVHPQDNPNSPKQVDADESVTMEGDNVSVTDVTSAHAAPSEIAKVARAERLADTILGVVASAQFEQEVAPAAALEADGIEKVASEADPDILESFLAFHAGFERGLQKKAEDINEVVGSGLAPSEEEAAALLDAAAVQNPEAVLPEEAQPEADMSEEDMAALDALAGELEAAGVTPEELMEAQAQVEQIKAETGASDEDIIQMLTEEGGAPAEEAPVEEEVPMEKVASEEDRKDALRAALAGITSAK
jgi:hypothetical protein